MPYFDTTWYVSSVKYAAVTARPQNAAVVAGQLVRQFTTPAVGNERVFVCTVAGTTANTTDASWGVARGSTTLDGTARFWECTGVSAVNGDLANTQSWSQLKASGNPGTATIIKRNNGASYQLCTGAGLLGATEPAFSDTPGATTADSSSTWTCIGLVGSFPAWGAPHARLANAYAISGLPGNRFFLADNHAETQATLMNLLCQALAGVASYNICVDRTASLPPVEANYNTGAAISTTGANSINFTTSIAGSSTYYQGIRFSAGDGSSNAALTVGGASSQGNVFAFKNCAFALGNTHASSLMTMGIPGVPGPRILWDNCTVQFANASQVMRLQCMDFEWKNTPSAIQGSTFPSVLFTQYSSGPMLNAVFRGVDFSAFSGQLLMNNPVGLNPMVFEDCKFHASMTRYGTSNTAGATATQLITVRCD